MSWACRHQSVLRGGKARVAVGALAFAAVIVLLSSLSLRPRSTEEHIISLARYLADGASSGNTVGVHPTAVRISSSPNGQDGGRFSQPVAGGGGGGGGGLVFIKSFKTGSTTLATYIAQVGHQRGSYFLHPRKKGWFARGELESRRDQGQTFDVSQRHVTPYTAYGVLEQLVPGATFVTIMRRPVDRFLSLFNFRHELKEKFKTPQALVAAIHAGKLGQGDGRPFCNQLAWLMSGRDADYTGISDEAEVDRVAGEVIAEADRRGVMVLITERMSESFAVLAHHMQWDLEELKLVAGSQRVQRGSREYFTCPGNENDVNNLCFSAITGCNKVDEVLYRHYERKFEELVLALPPSKSLRAGTMLDDLPRAERSTSALDIGKYPINCIANEGPRGTERVGLHGEELYRHLHSCEGRPA